MMGIGVKPLANAGIDVRVSTIQASSLYIHVIWHLQHQRTINYLHIKPQYACNTDILSSGNLGLCMFESEDSLV